MAEHDSYGIEFLKATTRIKSVCSGTIIFFYIFAMKTFVK